MVMQRSMRPSKPPRTSGTNIGTMSGKFKYPFFRAERATMLRQRTNQLLVQFAYMPDPEPIFTKNENNVYELRSYKLKSGTQVLSNFTSKRQNVVCRVNGHTRGIILV